MATSVQIDLRAQGGQQVQSALRMMADGATQVRKALADSAEAADQAADKLEKLGGANKDAVTAMRAKAEAIRTTAEAALQTEDKAIEAYRREQAEIRKTADELKKTEAETKKYGQALSSAGSPAEHLKTTMAGVARAAGDMVRSLKSGGGEQALGGMVMQATLLEGALKRVDENKSKFSNLQQAAQTSTNVGLGVLGAGAVGAYGLEKGLSLAGTKESELKAIEAFTGSKATAEQHYKITDELSVKSDFNLPQLVAATKDLDKVNLFSPRALKAVDDLAAANKQQGVDPGQVALELGYLKNGQSGRALMELARYGVTRPALERKGVKFDASGALDDKSEAGTQAAVDAVISVIQDKFGGLSEKLATETMEGAFSNLEDAVGRLVTTIDMELVPAITTGTKWLTGIVSFFTDLPEPLKMVLAWGSVLTVGVTLLGGGLLVAAGMAGQAFIAYAVLTGALEANTVAAGEAAIANEGAAAASSGLALKALPALSGALGTAAFYVLPLIEALLAYYWVSGLVTDAQKMSNEELQKAHPIMNTFWKFWGTIFDWFGDKIDWLRGLLHLGGQHQFDEKNIKDNYEADKKLAEKRGQVMEDYDTYRAKWIAKDDKASADETKADKNATYGRTEADRELNKANTPAGMQSAPDFKAEAAKLMAGFSPGTTTVNLSGASINLPQGAGAATAAGTGATTTVAASGAGLPSAGDIQEQIYAAQDEGGPGAKKKIRELTREKARAARAKAAAAATAKQSERDEIAARIAALGDGSADVAQLQQLHDQLREAERQKNVVESAVLKERIARATEVAHEQKADAAEHKREQTKAEREKRQIEDDEHRRIMRTLREQMARTKDKGAKAAMQRQIDAAEDAFRASRLPGGAAVTPLTATAGASALPTGGVTPPGMPIGDSEYYFFQKRADQARLNAYAGISDVMSSTGAAFFGRGGTPTTNYGRLMGHPGTGIMPAPIGPGYEWLSKGPMPTLDPSLLASGANLPVDGAGAPTAPRYSGYNGPEAQRSIPAAQQKINEIERNVSGTGTPRIESITTVRGKAVVQFAPLEIDLNQNTHGGVLTGHDISQFAPPGGA